MDMNSLKENIFAEIDTMTADQGRLLVKAFVSDIIDISVQVGTLAAQIDGIGDALQRATKIKSHKKLVDEVCANVRRLADAATEFHTSSRLSAARLQAACQTIDPIAGRDQSPVQ